MNKNDLSLSVKICKLWRIAAVIQNLHFNVIKPYPILSVIKSYDSPLSKLSGLFKIISKCLGSSTYTNNRLPNQNLLSPPKSLWISFITFRISENSSTISWKKNLHLKRINLQLKYLLIYSLFASKNLYALPMIG